MRIFVLTLYCAGLLAACRNDQPTTGNTPAQPEATSQAAANAELPADFQAFYRQFHADSVYQVEHILWPLPGETSQAIGDTTQGIQQSTYWQRENWRMHHSFDAEFGEFQRTFEQLGDVLIIERIRARGANYGLERRFSKQGEGEWQLIYYSDMHELRK
jgi:hypothetical protein